MESFRNIPGRRVFIICVAVVLCYTLVGFFLAPWLVRHYAPQLLHDRFNTQAAVGKVRINPFAFSLEADDFHMEAPGGQPLLDCKQLFVDFELRSLFKWAWTFRHLRLAGPYVNAVIAKDGSLNLAGLLPASGAASNRPPRRLIVEELSIDGGRLDFTDQRQSTPASITFEPLQLHIRNLTTLPGQQGPQAITATLDDGGSLQWTGEIGLNPVAAQGTFSIENIQATTAWEFIRDAVRLEPPAGSISIRSDYELDLGQVEPQVRLANLELELTGLALKLEGAQGGFLELPDARVAGGRIDLTRHQADIERVVIVGGHARMAMDESGRFNVEQLARTPRTPGKAAPPASANPWALNLASVDLSRFTADYQDRSRTPGLAALAVEIQTRLKARVEAGETTQVTVRDINVMLSGLTAARVGDPEPDVQIRQIGIVGGSYDLTANAFRAENVSVEGGTVDLKRLPDGGINLARLAVPPPSGTGAAAQGRPFRFLSKAVALSGFKARLFDLAVKPEAPILSIDELTASLTNVDAESPMTFDARIKVGEGGQIRANGTLNPAGPKIESDVEVAGLGLAPFQPYVSRSASIDLKSGTLSTRGKLVHGADAAGARTDYRGEFTIENLRVTEPGGNETLAGWKSAQTDQFDLQLEPNRIQIGDLKLVQPTGKLIIERDRSLNVANMVKPGSDVQRAKGHEGETSGAGDDAFAYQVHRILVSGGDIDFADLSLTTPFRSRIHELRGVVTGVSSTRNATAKVKLDGRVDEYGTANASGELNTSDPKSFTDLSVRFRNMEMSKLTPYSGEFAGRKIRSGKLSADLKYKITKSRLAGDNRLVVDRLVLGEKVHSPGAVDLPLDLAVALLQDSNGVIELGLPVSGNLSSPHFSFSALVGKALSSLITKTVTSPFNAIASVLPGKGKESFHSIDFEPGKADLTPPEQEKLAQLAAALQKRPQLRLSIQGRYNLDTDRAEIKSAGVRHDLTVRLGRKLENAEDPGPVDFSDRKTERALEAMFSERFGKDAVKQLKNEKKSAKEGAAGKSGVKARTEEEGQGRFARDLFARLVEAQPVDDTALVRLADARSQAIVAELTRHREITADRIDVKASAVDQTKESESAALDLVAMR